MFTLASVTTTPELSAHFLTLLGFLGECVDQRDNRQAFFEAARHGQWQQVLNCFCYTGGFTVAALAGMRWLPPLVLHGAHRASEAEVAAHAGLFGQRLQQWPAWPEIADMDPTPPCEVPADARPADTLSSDGP